MKKKVLAVLLGGCMVVGMLAGCGSKADDTKKADGDTKTDGSGDSKGYHFEVVVKSFQSSYWQAAVQGINQACDELGVTANTTGPNAESDIADQVNMLNNAINKNPDGIALAACDQNSVLGSLQSALDKKIPVVCFDSGVPDAPEGSVYATVVTDNERLVESQQSIFMKQSKTESETDRFVLVKLTRMQHLLTFLSVVWDSSTSSSSLLKLMERQ